MPINQFLSIEGINSQNTEQGGLEFYDLTQNYPTNPLTIPGELPSQQQNTSLISPDGSIFWSINYNSSGYLTLIPFYFANLQTGVTITTSITDSILALYFDSTGENFYIVCSNHVYIFNLSTLSITNTITLPALPTYYQTFLTNGAISSAIQPNKEFIWLLYPDGSIQSLNLSTYVLSSVINVILPYETVINGITYVYLPELSSEYSFLEITPDNSTIWLAVNFTYNEQSATTIGFNGNTTTTTYTGNNVFNISLPSGLINSTINVITTEFNGLIISPSNSNVYISFNNSTTFINNFLLINSNGTNTFQPPTAESPSGGNGCFLFNSDASILYYTGSKYTVALNTSNLQLTTVTSFVGPIIGVVNLNVAPKPIPLEPFKFLNYRFHFLNCNFLSDFLSQEVGIDK